MGQNTFQFSKIEFLKNAQNQCVNYPCVIGGELIGDCQFQLPDFSPKQPNFCEKLTIQIHI